VINSPSQASSQKLPGVHSLGGHKSQSPKEPLANTLTPKIEKQTFQQKAHTHTQSKHQCRAVRPQILGSATRNNTIQPRGFSATKTKKPTEQKPDRKAESEMKP
jgi:hypothetical protein